MSSHAAIVCMQCTAAVCVLFGPIQVRVWKCFFQTCILLFGREALSLDLNKLGNNLRSQLLSRSRAPQRSQAGQRWQLPGAGGRNGGD